MTGIKDHNIPAFVEAAARLRFLGYTVISPAETDCDQHEKSWEDWMRLDLKILCDCESIAVLDGWEDSRGASLEVTVARALGIPVISASTLEYV